MKSHLHAVMLPQAQDDHRPMLTSCTFLEKFHQQYACQYDHIVTVNIELYQKHVFRSIGVEVSIGQGVCSSAASNKQNVSAASIMQYRGVPSSFKQTSARAVEIMQL
jgi:hypothetical protein